MSAESIFTIVFVLFLLAIPFFAGRQISRGIRQVAQVYTLASQLKHATGRIIGFTERRYDSENTKQFYAVVEYRDQSNRIIWAETESCDKSDYALNTQVTCAYHARDRRSVMLYADTDILRKKIGIEKYIEMAIGFVMFLIPLLMAIYYKGFSPYILGPYFVSALAGFMFGWKFQPKDKFELRARIREAKARRTRLQKAQAIGEIPCHLYESTE